MAKFLYIYSPTRPINTPLENLVRDFFFGFNAFEYVKKSENELLYINNVKGVRVEGFQFALGSAAAGYELNSLPYFSFKFNATQDLIELTPDRTASRAIWYFIGDREIIVSSSQRLIVKLIKSFKLHPQALSWFIVTGSLGPGNSWDSRLRIVRPGKRVELTKGTFAEKQIATKLNVATDSKNLGAMFEEVFRKFETDKYVITLSGGYDSRVVAANMSRLGLGAHAFTWGTRDSLKNPGSDSFVAAKVAHHLGLPFTFIDHSPGAEDPKVVFDRFLNNGEGRTDHINALVDGLNFWKKISEAGHQKVVRADEVFGWLNVSDEKDVRISLDINLPSDYRNLTNFIGSDLEQPLWPAEFERSAGETLEHWRDRLYREYRIPCILSSLVEPALMFVEIINPMLYDPFVTWAMAQPDEDRTNKIKYRRYADTLVQEIAYAKHPAIPEPEAIFNHQPYRNYIIETLKAHKNNPAFGSMPAKALQILATPVTLHGKRRSWIKSMLPYWTKKILRRTVAPYQLHDYRIVLRIFLAIKMIDILNKDAD